MRLSPFGLLDRWLAPPPAPAKVAWIGRHGFAHRGLHGAGGLEPGGQGPNVPENSLSAFAAAIACGLGIECDVQRSRDGQAVVFHDWDLDRLTAETGPVDRHSTAQLSAIALAGGEDRIPTLGQVLGQVDGKVPLLIEVKSARDRRVAALCLAVRRALEGYRGVHAVMSFDPRVSRWFALHSQGTVRGLVITEENAKTLRDQVSRHLALWHARPDFLAYDVRDLPSRFAAGQRARGLPIAGWTVRSAELRERAALHADAPIAEGAGLSGLLRVSADG